MKTYKRKLVISFGLAFALLTFILGILSPRATLAKPLGWDITNDITAPFTLTLINSPYVLVNDIKVATGVTLTIEPGVVVYGRTGTELQIQGHLEAIGTVESGILFSSEMNSGAQQWPGLIFNGGTGNLQYVTVRYGGQKNNVTGVGSNIAIYNVLNGLVRIENSAVYTEQTTHSQSGGLTIQDPDYGIYIKDSRAIINETLFQGNGNNGRNVDGNNNTAAGDCALAIAGTKNLVTVTGSTFKNNYGFPICSSALNVARMVDNGFIDNGYPTYAADNGRNRIRLAGEGIATDVVLDPKNGLEGYELDEDLIISPTAVLTVQPGTMIMGQHGGTIDNAVELRILGRLEAVGTATQPITFTSAPNNGAPGWGGLVFDGVVDTDGKVTPAIGHLKYVLVRFGGDQNSILYKVKESGGSNITARNSTLLIEDSHIFSTTSNYSYFGSYKTTDSYGIYADSSKFSINNTLLSDIGMGNEKQYVILTTGASTFTIVNSQIRDNYARGIGIHNSATKVAMLISCTTIANNKLRGLSFDNGNLISLAYSNIFSDGLLSSPTEKYGLFVSNSVLPGHITATNNWWGHATGPTNPVTNKNGKGTIINGEPNRLPTSSISPWASAPIQCADLAAAKSSAVNRVSVGYPLTYTIVVTNNGPGVAKNIVITDTLPANTSYSSSDANCQYKTTTTAKYVVCNMASMELGQVMTVNLVVTPTRAGALVNKLDVVGSSMSDPNNLDSSNIAANTTVDMLNADVEITKSLPVTPTVIGDFLTYTIAITNHGPQPAIDLFLTDTLNANLKFVTTTTTSRAKCPKPASNVVNCTLDRIEVDESVRILLVVSPTTTGTVTNTVVISGYFNDTNISNNKPLTPTTTKIHTVSVDLQASINDINDPVTIDKPLTYVVAITNAGPSVAKFITLTDILPVGTVFDSYDSSSMVCHNFITNSLSMVTCTLKSLGYQEMATATLVVTAPSKPEAITNTITISNAIPELDLSDNTARTSTTVNPIIADMSVSQAVTPSRVVVNLPITYTIVMTNGGPEPADVLTLTDTILQNVDFVTATLSQPANCGNTKDISGTTVICTVDNVANGTVVTATLVFIPRVTNTITNTADVANSELDPTPNNNAPSVETYVNTPAADLSISKLTEPLQVVVDRPLTYTLVISNGGPETAPEVTLVYTLPANLDFNAITSTQGNCGVVNGLITCALDSLAKDGVITVTVLVTPTMPGVITNTIVVTSTVEDPNQEDNTTPPDESAPALSGDADLSILKSDTPNPVMVGSPLTYQAVVINNGPDTANGVIVTDTLPAGVQFSQVITSQGTDCQAMAGVITCNLGKIRQMARATMTIVVTPTVRDTVVNMVAVGGQGNDPFLFNNLGYENSTILTLPSACPKTIQSVKNGNWNDATTWDLNRLPTATDVVLIQTGQVIIAPATIKIAGLCNLGTLQGQPNNNLRLQVTTAITNYGQILSGAGEDDKDRCGKAGGMLTLLSNLLYNESTIQAGNGGNGLSCGGDGGAVTILSRNITNIKTGIIRAGNGGNGQRGGQGGQTHLLGSIGGDGLVVNRGQVYAGNGGLGSLGASGNGGDLKLLARPYVFIDGGIQAAGLGGTAKSMGKNGSVFIEPTMIGLSGEGTEIRGENVTIFGGDNWLMDLTAVSSSTITATNKLKLAVGQGGLVDLRGNQSQILRAGNQVEVASDMVLLDAGVQLADVLGTNAVTKSNEVLADGSLIGPSQAIGRPSVTLPITFMVVNGGPLADTFTIKVDNSAKWSGISGWPLTIQVNGLDQQEFSFNVPLPGMDMLGKAAFENTITVTLESSKVTLVQPLEVIVDIGKLYLPIIFRASK